jgi:hypothetical protein
MMVDKRDDEKFRGFESGYKFFSKCVWVDLYVGVVGLCFMKEYFDCWELRKIATIH